jgi:hypothetical protein
MQLPELPAIYQGKDWSSWGELAHFTFYADASTGQKLQNYLDWKATDRTKKGLLEKVGLRPDAPSTYNPNTREKAA